MFLDHDGHSRVGRLGINVLKMLSGDEYRKRANECIAAADNAAGPERRVGLLELAQRWLRLAFQVDKIEDRKGVRGGCPIG
jgi:hypothetical protein